jgi:hypothetical protein
MAQQIVPAWSVSNYVSLLNGSGASIPANVACVVDSANARSAKRPANGANGTAKAVGISRKAIADGQGGDFAGTPGDIAVATANGAIAKGDTVFVTTADAGKEGYLKKYTDFATDGAVTIVGFALSVAADGELFEMLWQSPYVKTA